MKEAFQHLIPTFIKEYPWQTAIVLLILTAGGFRIYYNEPPPPPIQYQVRVQAHNTNLPLTGAKITLDVTTGQSPFYATTDSNGFASMRIPGELANQKGRLIVEATDFRTESIVINIIADDLPSIILLEAE